MTASTRALYAIGFAIGIMALGFGLFLQYDQFRLFLALGGFSLLLIIGASGFYGLETNGNIKIEKISEENGQRITSASTVKPALFTPERVREFPLSCAFCNLLISPAMKQIIVGSEHYHEDCWPRQIERNRKDLSPGKGRLDSV